MTSEWKPIESAPKEGSFLVWLKEPSLGHHVWPMRRHPNVSTIGHNFHYDVGEPTHWAPFPDPPKPQEDAG